MINPIAEPSAYSMWNSYPAIVILLCFFQPYMGKPDKEGTLFSLTIEHSPDKISLIKIKKVSDHHMYLHLYTFANRRESEQL